MKTDADGRLRKFEVMGLDSRIIGDINLLRMEHNLEAGIKLHRETMKNKRGRTNDITSYSIDTTINDNNYKNGIREHDTRKAKAITAFVQNTIHLTDKTTVTPGFRIERYDQKRELHGGGEFPEDITNKTHTTEFIPGIGATHKLSQNVVVFGGIHKGFAPPRVADAISNDGDAVDLDAERSTNYELGLRGSTDKFQYEATLFRLDFKNQVVQATESGGSSTEKTNGGKTLNQGIELSGNVDLGGGFGLGGNYTYLHTAKLNNTRILDGIDRKGNRLSYAPKHLVNLVASYKENDWGSSTRYSYVSKQFTDLQNTKVGSGDGLTGIIPSYSLVDLNSWYNINKNATLNLAIKNIADKKYISSRAPRGIFPGM